MQQQAASRVSVPESASAEIRSRARAIVCVELVHELGAKVQAQWRKAQRVTQLQRVWSKQRMQEKQRKKNSG
jgi:hypothetical protein